MAKTICIIDNCMDPYWNLAAEEYLLKSMDCPVFRLWRNSDAIIIGQNQNALAEINYDWVKANRIPVVRRMSGGGAVFHDPGNINFTFIEKRIPGEDTSDMFRRFTRPIIGALKGLGIDAYLEGRNDLLIDGRKFAGNAVAMHKDRVLQHGCILFSASMPNLAEALRSRPEKFVGKAVSSNRSRVTNISEHLDRPMSAEDFIFYLRDSIISGYGDDMELYEYSPEDLDGIDALADSKYRTDAWNFGKSPRFSISQVRKFPAGLLEIYAEIKEGRIVSVNIMGDYFFESPTEDVENALIGCEHKKEAVLDRLNRIDISRYFSNIPCAEIADMFF